MLTQWHLYYIVVIQICNVFCITLLHCICALCCNMPHVHYTACVCATHQPVDIMHVAVGVGFACHVPMATPTF